MFSACELNELYQYAYSLTAQVSGAESLLQTALEKYFNTHTIKQPLSYLRKIIRSQYIDDCQRKQLLGFEPLEQDVPVMLDTTSLERQLVDKQRVDQLFARLNTAEREVLYLWAVVGYSASDIAKELNQSRASVLSRLYRSRQKILDECPGATIQAKSGGLS